MALQENELAQRVAVALLYNVLEDRKPQIQNLLHKHGYKPSDELDDLFYQVVQVSNERGKFFDGDLIAEAENAGYFGVDDLAAAGLKITGEQFKTVVNAVKNLKDKKYDEDGNKVKLKDRLKGIFQKGAPAPSSQTIDKEAMKDIAKHTVDKGKEDEVDDGKDDKKPKKTDKKILGMSVGLFVGMAFFLALIAIVLIVVIRMRKGKNKGAGASKD